MPEHGDQNRDWISFRMSTELQWGIDKNSMLHLNVYLSNVHQQNFRFEGLRLYYKYRFYSRDEQHKHFRMAAFARVGLANNPFSFNEISLGSDNTGFEIGWIGTQLVKKYAISFTASYSKAFNNWGFEMPSGQDNHSINYSIANGLLLFPFEYKNYDQTNINVYAEFLGKVNPESGQHYLDIAPAIQFIFKSQMRLDFAYRQQIFGNMNRMGEQQFVVKFLYLFFNVY